MKKLAILISALLVTTGVLAATNTGIIHKKSDSTTATTHAKAKPSDAKVSKVGTKAAQ